MLTAGELLRHYRKQIPGMTQERLATDAGTSNQNISRFECGDRPLRGKWRERLAPHLNINPDDLKPGAPIRSPAKRNARELIDVMTDEQVQALIPLLDATAKLSESG